jgi:hypothetical protein
MCYFDIFQNGFIIGHNLRIMKVNSVIVILPSSYNRSINLLAYGRAKYLETLCSLISDLCSKIIINGFSTFYKTRFEMGDILISHISIVIDNQ